MAGKQVAANYSVHETLHCGLLAQNSHRGSFELNGGCANCRNERAASAARFLSNWRGWGQLVRVYLVQHTYQNQVGFLLDGETLFELRLGFCQLLFDVFPCSTESCQFRLYLLGSGRIILQGFLKVLP